jgi:hypothetical protein
LHHVFAPQTVFQPSTGIWCFLGADGKSHKLTNFGAIKLVDLPASAPAASLRKPGR